MEVMKYRALLCLVTLSVAGALVTGCGGTPKPPVNSARHLQEIVEVGQTLDEFQELMTDSLRERSTIYPAESVEKKASGNWSLKAKAGASIGETDAPYLAVVVKPDPDNTKYYTVFFKDGKVIDAEWFVSTYASFIHQVLGNQLDLEGSE